MVTWEGRFHLQICFQVKYIIPIILYPKSIPLFRATGRQTSDDGRQWRVTSWMPEGFCPLPRITHYEL